MEILFKASKSGNLKELIHLKEQGFDLKTKDCNGNSLFLWAACSGHLDIVQWLIKESIAQIEEQNDAGNTALLLSAAYGHTELCKWLLDAGANPNTKNKFNSTALLIALKHNQLSIVDLLVRQYQQIFEQNSKTYCNDTAIQYYIEIVELFSQNPNDDEAILLLIKKASTQLSNDELSFIFLIYHWLDIHNRVKNSSVEAPSYFFVDQLALFHRAELLSYMLDVGFILTNDTHQRVIHLNTTQKKLVSEWLEISGQDNYLLSKESQTERKELYVTFYIIPLYHALVYALKIDGDLNANLNRVLKAPYCYSNLTNDSIINVDVAKCVAYHLCRQGLLSLQQHIDTYQKTTNLSRREYYNILMLCIDDNDPNKNKLLFDLGNIPDINGERLYWSYKYPSWLEELECNFRAKDITSQNGTLKLIGVKQVIHLSNDTSSEIWDSEKHEPKPTSLPGRHPVYHLKEQGVFCKLYPGLPGINDALHFLYRRLFSAKGGLPWSVTGLLEIDEHIIPVLISKDAGERILSNDERLLKLDHYELSKLILFSILSNPEDGKYDNFTAMNSEEDTFSIFSVDNDQGLVEGTIETGVWIFQSKKLSMKTIIFCLDYMNQPLHPRAVQEFLALNSVEIIIEWLKDLVKLESEYEILFKDCCESFAKETNFSRLSYLYVLMPILTVMNIAFKLQSLKSILTADNSITAISLLKEVEFDAAHYYTKILCKPKSATARFDELASEGKLYGYSKITKTFSTTLSTAKELFESLVPAKYAHSVSPRIALELFTIIAQQWDLISEAFIKVSKGNLGELTSLPIEIQQNLLKLIQFKQLHPHKIKLFIEHISHQEKFTEVYLHHTQQYLLDKHLSDVIKNNKHLTRLSIKNASGLTTLAPLNPIQTLVYLRLIQLPNALEVKANLPNVTEIIIKNLPKITSIQLDAPNLQKLFIINCPQLQILNLKSSFALNNVSIIDCDKLPLASFYSIWPGFISRWDGEPLGFCKKLADYIVQSFPEMTLVNTKLVYESVANYLEKIIQIRKLLISQKRATESRFFWDEEYFVISEEFFSAYVLAHLQYEHPLVIKNLMKCFSYFYELILSFEKKLVLIQMLISALGSLQQLNNPHVYQPILKWLNLDPGASKVSRETCNCAICQLKRQVNGENRTMMTITRKKIVQNVLIEELVNLHITDPWYIEWLTPHSRDCSKCADFLHLLQQDRVSSTKKELCGKDISFERLDIKCLTNTDYQKDQISTAKAFADHYQFENFLGPKFAQIKRTETNALINDSGNFSSATHTLSIISTSTPLSPLLLAATEGNLSVLKTLLYENAQLIKEKNSIGDSALSLAVKNDHLHIADYLIRYHYMEIPFDENERLALDFLSLNKRLSFYFQLLQLLSSSKNSKKINELLESAKSECNADDLSIIYLLYLWMNINSNEETALNSIELEYKKPLQHQLTAAHQSELILHMIRQGNVLRDWYIDSNELTLTNMVIDKKQVDALEQLLQQGRYQFCLQSENHTVRDGKIYIAFKPDGLHYTVRDRTGVLQHGLVASEALGCSLTAPLTLDQLPSLPQLLEQIASSCDLRLPLERFILNNIRFTKSYRLDSKDKRPILPNIFYIKNQSASKSISYTLLDPTGKRVTDTIPYNELKKLGWNIQPDLVKSLEPIFSKILEITSSRGHTNAECFTKGYSTFLALLESQFLITKLQTLQLFNCSLSDNYDMPALYPILAKCTSLQYLNLDQNHITEIGLHNILTIIESKEQLQVLSVCFNDIEVKTVSALSALTLASRHLKEIIVTGNRFADKHAPVKSNHHKRLRALQLLFGALSEVPNLTIGAFLTASQVELIRTENENYLFSITLLDARVIKVALSKAAFGAFNDLCFEEQEQQRRRDRSLTTPQEIFSFLISGITPGKLPQRLASSLISSDKEVCRQLLYHHIDAPLKGHLINHTLFRTEKIMTRTSYLYPNEKITSSESGKGLGLVYLIANNLSGISMDEHTMIGYEYITSYGQHIFKVAHIQHIKDKNITYIEFIPGEITSILSFLNHKRLIAKFKVDSQRIKKMHHSILQDKEYQDLPHTIYSSVISGSSMDLDKEKMNCLTYCLKKMRDYLDIKLVPDPLEYRPSAFVRKCISQSQEREEYVKTP